jgi:methylmalonyl-CoA mutase
LEQLGNVAKTGKGNLLEASIQAARVRCTVGEISDALENVFGRYKPTYSMARGAYKSSYGAAKDIEVAAQVLFIK